MSKLNELIIEIENQVSQAKQDMDDARQYGVNSAGFNAYMGRMEMAEQLLENARQLLAEEQEAKPQPTAIDGHGVISCPHCFKPVLNDVKPTADKGLVEELREWGSTRGLPQWVGEELSAILSRYEAKQEEPLACLADRKGFYIAGIGQINGRWRIKTESPDMEYTEERDTYAEAESEARQYLMGLPDREGR